MRKAKRLSGETSLELIVTVSLLLLICIALNDCSGILPADLNDSKHQETPVRTLIPGSCTIFCISYDGNVFFGNNEDYKNPLTYYWIDPPGKDKYGVLYFGFDDFFPQGGVNEKGLAFDGNALPPVSVNRHPEKLKASENIVNDIIMHGCATLEEALETAISYDWGGIYRGEFAGQYLLADPSGDAAVIGFGPDGELAVTRKPRGNGYIVSTNFNRANPENRYDPYPCYRFSMASAMLEGINTGDDLTVGFLASVLDSVHTDGEVIKTLYSNIFDLKNGVAYLYCMHDFNLVHKMDVREIIKLNPSPERIENLFRVRHLKEINMKSVLLLTILFCLIAFVTVLFVISPGRLKPYVNQDGQPVAGSIAEKRFITIGGIEQGMFIRGKDTNNPVLLFVHGGPAFSEFFLVEKYPAGLEDYFTVCYWEQRGGGISFTPMVTLESMTLQQLASDAIEVANYLCSRFDKDKIYIMAHSGGTPFAIRAVYNSPRMFHAYVGISQITRQTESEKIAYKYMLDRYIADGNKKMVAQFKKYPILEDDSFVLPFLNSVLRDKAMHDLGIGTMHNMRSIIKDVFLPVWTCRAYTVKEKLNIWISKYSFITKSGLRKQVLSSDIPAEVPSLDVPVYFFSGKYDLTVNKDLAREYLEKIEAPVKGFYTFDESAHSPMFEEPQRLREILVKDVLNGTANLADN